MKNSVKFRGYAEECRQLLINMRPEHQATLLEIANAWDQRAEEAEAGEAKGGTHPEPSADAAESLDDE